MHDDLAQQLDRAKERAEKAGWDKSEVSNIIRDEIKDRNEQGNYNPHPTTYGELNEYLRGRDLNEFNRYDQEIV